MPAAARPRREPRQPLDTQALKLNSLASIFAALFSSALGASELASLLLAAIAPALTVLVTHNGPHRRRRIALVVVLLALSHFVQDVLARLRGRRVRSKSHRLAGWGRGLRFAELTACIAFAISVVALTVPELVLGDALVSDRRLTMFPFDDRPTKRPLRPTPTPTPTPTATRTPTPTPRAPKRTPQPVRTPTPMPHPNVPPPDPPAGDPDPPARDRTAPVLELPDGLRARATGRHGAVVDYRARARDSVDGAVTPSCSPASGSRFAVGTTIVHCTVRDHAGNSAAGSFRIRVDAPPAPTRTPTPAPTPRPTPEKTATPEPTPEPDTTDPVFTRPGSLIVVDSQEPRGTPVGYPPPEATDDRDPSVDVTCTPATVPAGTRDRVGCTAVDDPGNSTQATFMVYVRSG